METNVAQNRSPISRIAAAIYMATEKSNFKSVEEISEILGLSERTLKKTRKEMYLLPRQLLL